MHLECGVVTFWARHVTYAQITKVFSGFLLSLSYICPNKDGWFVCMSTTSPLNIKKGKKCGHWFFEQEKHCGIYHIALYIVARWSESIDQFGCTPYEANYFLISKGENLEARKDGQGFSKHGQDSILYELLMYTWQQDLKDQNYVKSTQDTYYNSFRVYQDLYCYLTRILLEWNEARYIMLWLDADCKSLKF